MTLKEIGQEAHTINKHNGFDVFWPHSWPEDDKERAKIHLLCTHMALVHTEVAEATEAVRHLDRANFDEELADVIIRVTSIASGLGIDLEPIVMDKMARNAQRGLRHGGKSV